MIIKLEDLNRKSIQINEDIFHKIADNEKHLNELGFYIEDEDLKDDLMNEDFIHVFVGNYGYLIVKG